MDNPTPDEIINRAYKEKNAWRSKGYRRGKFIIGVEIRTILLSTLRHADEVDEDQLLGHPYVVDYNNELDIDFCPIE